MPYGQFQSTVSLLLTLCKIFANSALSKSFYYFSNILEAKNEAMMEAKYLIGWEWVEDQKRPIPFP